MDSETKLLYSAIDKQINLDYTSYCTQNLFYEYNERQISTTTLRKGGQS